MILKNKVIGSQLFFAREGTVIAGEGGGTVSQTYLPTATDGAAPGANWPSMGRVKDFTANHKEDTLDLVLPSPGRYQRVDEIVQSTMLDLSFSIPDMSPLFWETMLLGKADPDSGIYSIGSSNGRVRGWLKVMQYDQADEEQNLFNVYVSATFKPVKFENKLIITELDAKVLFSALATGTLTFA